MSKTPYLSETKDDCYYYNYGGNSSFHGDRPPYPKAYGARCEFYEKFFFSKRQWAGGKYEGLKPDCSKCREYRNKEEEMNPAKHFYGESLFERNKNTYGLHPKCKKCFTRREGKCKDPQYAAINVGDFYCADYKEEK